MSPERKTVYLIMKAAVVLVALFGVGLGVFLGNSGAFGIFLFGVLPVLFAVVLWFVVSGWEKKEQNQSR